MIIISILFIILILKLLFQFEKNQQIFQLLELFRYNILRLLLHLNLLTPLGIAFIAGFAIVLRLLAYKKQWHLPTLTKDY